MKRLFAFLVLVLLTAAYLYPGSAAMIVGSTNEVMSDNTDIAPLPLTFTQLDRVFHEDPKRFFFGSVYIDRFEPEQGQAAWVSISERWLALVLGQIFPVEQVSTALVFFYMLASAVAMFALAHALGWRDTICYGLAVAWGISFYSLARAQVHTDFTALYHIPLIFLSLLLTARAKKWWMLSLPALLLLLAATVPHYYLITAAFLTPLFLLFYFLQPELRGRKLVGLGRLAIAAVPVVLLIGLNFGFPVPPEAKAKMTNVIPQTGATPEGMIFHPFMLFYSARPIDYLTGPLWPGSWDPNPWRDQLNKAVQTEVMGDGRKGNFHERTNGIRWMIWLLALCAPLSFLGARIAKRELTAPERETRRMIFYFVGLGLFAFLLALAPRTTHPNFFPAYWLYSLVKQVRVPSRAGMYVGFSLLMIAGYWINSTFAPQTLRKMLFLPVIFPLLILAEFPPMSRVQMAPMRPQIEELNTEHGACGAGLYFPFVSNADGVLDYYYFQQRMRGTNCQVLNSLAKPERLNWLTARFPPTGAFLKQLHGDETASLELERVARCVPLSWIVFDPHVSKSWAEGVCGKLGWKLNPADGSCVAPDHSVPLLHYPDDCG